MPTAPNDPTTSDEIGEPQKPSDMRPTGSPVPDTTQDDQTNGRNQP